MATADELLGTIADITDDFLVVDLNTRIISIPASIKILGVESDDDVKHLHFKLPKNFGKFDLSTFSIQVNFKNANGEGDFYPVNDIVVEDDMMTFTWLVDRHAFKRYGEVNFSLCMKKFDEAGVVVKELNTAIASLPVLEGLETTKAVVENNPSAFDAVLFRLYAVEAATGNSQNGYYTIASVNETDEGIEVTIVGSDGATVGKIRHGRDGYSPILGTDYWTEEDKVKIKTESKDYIDAWAPRTYTVMLTASGWTDHKQTVSAEGVSADNIVFIAPDPAYDNRKEYARRSICCSSQADGQLTFECYTVPTTDITINVTVFYSRNSVDSINRPMRIEPAEITAMFNS